MVSESYFFFTHKISNRFFCDFLNVLFDVELKRNVQNNFFFKSIFDCLFFFLSDSDSEGNIALKSAWSELAAIEREAKRYKEIREQTEKDLVSF